MDFVTRRTRTRSSHRQTDVASPQRCPSKDRHELGEHDNTHEKVANSCESKEDSQDDGSGENNASRNGASRLDTITSSPGYCREVDTAISELKICIDQSASQIVKQYHKLLQSVKVSGDDLGSDPFAI